MADKHHSDKQEKVESIRYNPGLLDSGDLEPGTRTITATSEASGLANADYSKVLGLAMPGDARLAVKRICCRLKATIDTIPSGDTNLYCRVYVDVQDADHLLLEKNWNSTGSKLDAVDTHSAALATIFNLLSDGASHTFYFFFWKAGTGTGVVLSLVQLWEGVGTCGVSNWWEFPVLELSHTGFMTASLYGNCLGTGTMQVRLLREVGATGDTVAVESGTAPLITSNYVTLIANKARVNLAGSVATDLNYVFESIFGLRRG
jgi:hypothetical protein